MNRRPIQQAPEVEEAGEQRSEMLHRLVLMRETGPKSARWERARRAMIWRLLRSIDRSAQRNKGQTADEISTGVAQDPGPNQPEVGFAE